MICSIFYSVFQFTSWNFFKYTGHVSFRISGIYNIPLSPMIVKLLSSGATTLKVTLAITLSYSKHPTEKSGVTICFFTFLFSNIHFEKE